MDLFSKLSSIGAVKDRLLIRLRGLLFGAAGFAVAGIAALAGLVFLIAAGWVALREHYGTLTANVAFGLGLLVVAAIAALWARYMMKSGPKLVAKVEVKEQSANIDPDIAAADTLTGENLTAAITLMVGVGYLIGNQLLTKHMNKQT